MSTSDTPTNWISDAAAERQGERLIPVSDIARVCQLTPIEKLHLEQKLKDQAAQHWLEHGGDPEKLQQKPQRVLVKSMMPGPHYSDPAYSQAVINELITRGELKPRKGVLESPFFKLPSEEQKAIIDGLVSGEPLPLQKTSTGAMERLAVRAGLKDEVFRS